MGRVVDAAGMRRLLVHEARVHALPGRELRDLGDAILLHDPVDPEPFWNRLEAIRWPEEVDAFDRRLTEILLMFAAAGRSPHVWPAPLHDTPVDLADRLKANGFRDMGTGGFMVLGDRRAADRAATATTPTGVTVERLAGLRGPAATAAAAAIADILADAFDVDLERRETIEAETVSTLDHPWFTHYLVRWDGRPAAAARRATFEGASYLSSIGTAEWARGRGLASLVTGVASTDGAAIGDLVHLAVFADNESAIRVYERAGFERVGEPSPDLLLL